MPKVTHIARQLPPEKPDRCELCPLLGLIPKEERRKGLRESYYCLGIFEAEMTDNGYPVLDEDGEQKLSFPRLKSKGITVSAKAVKEGGHLLHRPCDFTWDAWMMLPGRLFGMPVNVYQLYRQPYEKEQMIKLLPNFKFRKRK